MKGLVTGILLGVGIGLVMAPMRGEEMRRLLSGRIQELGANELVQSYTKQVVGDMSLAATRRNFDVLGRLALSWAKENENTLMGLAKIAVDNSNISVSDLAKFATTAVTLARKIR